jgi:proton-dependent oligopeptide transporter, POT family
MTAYRTAPDHEETGWPKGVPYIIGNEGCERFSFYGMKAILFVYVTHLLANEGVLGAQAEREATELVHTFNAGVYALPMVGALIADRWWGKYPTIFWLSLVYCAGHACLALFDGDFHGSAIGLLLICAGAGGIKPCVSAHVGDQFGRGNWDKVTRVYQIFYFTVNFGAMFSTLLIPWVKTHYGFGYAFALPGVLMALATVAFWAGRHVFVHVPPRPGGKLGAVDVLAGALLFMVIALPMFGAGLLQWYAALSFGGKLGVSLACVLAGLAVFLVRQNSEADDGFLAVLVYSLRARFAGVEHDQHHQGDDGAPLAPFWGPAVRRFGREAAEGAPAVIRILTVFVMVSVFWALFDQHSSSWIAQARDMDRDFTLFGSSFTVLPEQIQAANPALVMMLVPLTGALLYPGIEKLGFKMTPLRRMTGGMFLTSLAFVIVALAQARLDAGEHVHVGWQLLAFVVLTLAEVMVSVTGLEFAYTQAPRRMKSLLMGFWLLTASLGNILVALLAHFQDLPRVQFFWTFAGLMLAAAVVFGVRAAFYKYQTYTQ